MKYRMRFNYYNSNAKRFISASMQTTLVKKLSLKKCDKDIANELSQLEGKVYFTPQLYLWLQVTQNNITSLSVTNQIEI